MKEQDLIQALSGLPEDMLAELAQWQQDKTPLGAQTSADTAEEAIDSGHPIIEKHSGGRNLLWRIGIGLTAAACVAAAVPIGMEVYKNNRGMQSGFTESDSAAEPADESLIELTAETTTAEPQAQISHNPICLGNAYDMEQFAPSDTEYPDGLVKMLRSMDDAEALFGAETIAENDWLCEFFTAKQFEEYDYLYIGVSLSALPQQPMYAPMYTLDNVWMMPDGSMNVVFSNWRVQNLPEAWADMLKPETGMKMCYTVPKGAVPEIAGYSLVFNDDTYTLPEEILNGWQGGGSEDSKSALMEYLLNTEAFQTWNDKMMKLPYIRWAEDDNMKTAEEPDGDTAETTAVNAETNALSQTTTNTTDKNGNTGTNPKTTAGTGKTAKTTTVTTLSYTPAKNDRTVRIAFEVPDGAQGTFHITMMEGGLCRAVCSSFDPKYANGSVFVTVEGHGQTEMSATLVNEKAGAECFFGNYQIDFDKGKIQNIKPIAAADAFTAVGGMKQTTPATTMTAFTTTTTTTITQQPISVHYDTPCYRWHDSINERGASVGQFDGQTIKLDTLPNTEFIWKDMYTVYVMDSSIGQIESISGMPIHNAYFSDLNGDGSPELCCTVMFGSGMIDAHLVVYDIRNRTEYTLWDRGNFDYVLTADNAGLLVQKIKYASYDNSCVYGRIAIENGALVFHAYENGVPQ